MKYTFTSDDGFTLKLGDTGTAGLALGYCILEAKGAGFKVEAAYLGDTEPFYKVWPPRHDDGARKALGLHLIEQIEASEHVIDAWERAHEGIGSLASEDLRLGRAA